MPAIQAEQGLVSGVLPLTPAQHWLFEQQLSEPHHWNQSLMVTMSEAPDQARLARALRTVIERHDALRTRFDLSNGPTARIEAIVPCEDFLLSVDLSQVSDQELAAAVSNEAERYQQSLNLEQGPLFRAVLFDLGPNRPGRLRSRISSMSVPTWSFHRRPPRSNSGPKRHRPWLNPERSWVSWTSGPNRTGRRIVRCRLMIRRENGRKPRRRSVTWGSVGKRRKPCCGKRRLPTGLR